MSEPIEATHHLSRRTTPTWEVELLISGVAVFAMLQLPGWLDDQVFALEPRLGADWRQILILSYIYAKSAAVILATTFVLHLLLRARWIALVGMHSVYPEGILLDRLGLGPIQRKIEQEVDQPMPTRIERADNLATTVFALGVMLATMLIAIAIAATTLYGLGMLAAKLSLGRLDASITMVVIFVLVMVPFTALVMLDRHKGAAWPAGGRWHRFVRACLRVYSRMGFSHSGNPVMALLASHGGDRKAILLTTTVMFVALASAVLSLGMQKNPGMFGSYGLFPKSPSRQVESAHYDDQRNPTRDPAVPYVQSSVIVGPYLKLVVPYRPLHDESAIRAICLPGTEDHAGEKLADARLACLQDLHAVTLDGRTLTDLRYEIASDPRTDRPALLAMIDVRDLPPGRHELRIARPPYSDRRARKNRPDPGHDRIVFWR